MTPDRHPLDTDADLPEQPPLRTCPFCGEQPILQPCLRHGYFVSCDNAACLAMPETRDFDTEEQAAQAWNSRAPVGVAV